MILDGGKLKPLILKEFKQHLSTPLDEVFGQSTEIGEITRFGKIKGAMDETTKLMVTNSQGDKIAVVLCSSPVSPKLLARDAKNSYLAKQLLEAELGNHILTPLYKGEFEGLTYRTPAGIYLTGS